jgi:hypothetical protein
VFPKWGRPFLDGSFYPVVELGPPECNRSFVLWT